MKRHLDVIVAIVKKDLIGLLPLVLTSLAVFMLAPVIANLELETDLQMWAALKAGFYWLGYFLAVLLMVSVIQQDPASSINHDWLTRPIARLDLLLAKLLFLFVTVCLPIVLARLVVNIASGHGFVQALADAAAVEKLPALLPVPFLFAVALFTGTLKKAIAVSISMLIILILPAWDLPRPLFAMLGIEFGVIESLAWLQAIPLALLGIGSATAVYWFAYCRRTQHHARYVLIVTSALIFIGVFPPRWLFDWDTAIAIQAALVNDTGETPEESVILEHTYACFPAFEVGDSIESEIAKRVFVDANWREEQLAHVEKGTLAFQTRVRVRGVPTDWFSSSHGEAIPLDWRVHRIRVQGSYAADSLARPVSIQYSTAANWSAPIAPTRAGYWMAPADMASRFANDPSARLILDYDLTLLSPTAYELPANGKRRLFPKLGYCSATRRESSNTIEVECDKRGPQPALVSAELFGVKSSRVDSYRLPNYNADWLEYLTKAHYELAIESPSLVDSSSVLVTAWEVERVFRKQLVSSGLLGGSPAICPPPSEQQFAAIEKSNWGDRSPHEISSIAVEAGVRLEVLDWRSDRLRDGRDTNQADRPTLVLVPGLGATAHSFDDLAPKLAQSYPVIGITRRGTGASSKPAYGYDPDRLSRDILQVLNTLDIKHPVLVGHSIGGEELSYIGAHYPDRVRGLIYLDAAYDRTGTAKRYRELEKLLPPTPPPRPAEFISYEASHHYAARLGASRNLPEGEILASYDFTSGENKLASKYLEAILANVVSPDYRRIPLPALAIYAAPTSPESLMKPWYDRDHPVIASVLAEMFERRTRELLAEIARFKKEVANSQVLVIDEGNHWIFLSHEAEVINAIHGFVADLQWNEP